jgi:colicin import membrane protein
MVSACNDFLSNHGEELEVFLYKGVVEDRDMRQRLCIETGICEKLWDAEAEEMKRDRSPEEARREGAEQQRKAKEEAKKKQEAEKAEKAEKAKKKKAEAAAAKAAREAADQAKEAAAAAAADDTPKKEEL